MFSPYIECIIVTKCFEMLFPVSIKYSGVLKEGPKGVPLAFFLKLAQMVRLRYLFVILLLDGSFKYKYTRDFVDVLKY
jgi:hypothetical protein